MREEAPILIFFFVWSNVVQKQLIHLKALNHVAGDGGVGISALHFDTSEVSNPSALHFLIYNLFTPVF